MLTYREVLFHNKHVILGIDLGRKKTGLAVSEGSLASPYKTISHTGLKQAVTKIISEIGRLGVNIIVLGYVEGRNKKYFEKFKSQIGEKIPNIKIILEEESLTTRQARQIMIKLHVPQKKKAKKEHEIAASIILQIYLDKKD